MKIGFEIEGPTKKTYRQIERQEKNVRRAIRQTFFYMGRHLNKKISDAIISTQGKTGREYIIVSRTGGRRKHRASAPGETHANLSGTLRKSLGWKVHGTNSLEIGYGVSGKPAPEHAEIEFGTEKVAERPSIKNAIDSASFETFFQEALAKLESR